MLQEESDLSLMIAQIVQKLKGSNLYAQLERQAWVSAAGWAAGWPGSLCPVLTEPALASAPASFAGMHGTGSWAGLRREPLLRQGGAHHALLRPEQRRAGSFICLPL